MDCDKGFSSSYMILKPEEVSLLDLFRLLISHDTEKRRFVDSSEPREESFRRRWLVFISVVLQKLLQFCSKPLVFVGSALEMGFNFLSCNNNLAQLFLNLLRGKVVKPDKLSATYMSFVGIFDKRLDLDKGIEHENEFRYFSALSIMASKLVYENSAFSKSVVEDHWKMKYLGFHDYWNDYQEKATTQACMFSDKTSDDQETIVVAFRGTEPFDSDAWCSNFDMSWYDLPGIGKIHGGFMKALGLQKNYGWPKNATNHNAPLAYYTIRDALKNLISQNENSFDKFVLTGHSQGGALAILFVAVLIMHEENMLLERLQGVYTFGQPRVGDATLAKFMGGKLKKHNIKYFRFVYCNDIVPRLPYDDTDLMFKHFGTCIYYDRHYNGKVVTEEPNKNYFSAVRMLQMMVNAFLKVIRSFTIAYKNGPEYQEGWPLRVSRVLGIIFPGISNHAPQDYVNATRLGILDDSLLSRDISIH